MTNIIVRRAVVIVKSHMGIEWSPGSRYRAVSCKGFSSSALTCENVEGFVGSWKHASKSEVSVGGRVTRTYSSGRSTAIVSSPCGLCLHSWESNKDIGPEALRILGILRPLPLQKECNPHPTRNSTTTPPTVPMKHILSPCCLVMVENRGLTTGDRANWSPRGARSSD